jgi:hypothetical protein
VWFSLAGEWRRGTPAPTAFRALAGLGFVMFLGGILWQFVGYWKTGVLSW